MKRFLVLAILTIFVFSGCTSEKVLFDFRNSNIGMSRTEVMEAEDDIRNKLDENCLTEEYLTDTLEYQDVEIYDLKHFDVSYNFFEGELYGVYASNNYYNEFELFKNDYSQIKNQLLDEWGTASECVEDEAAQSYYSFWDDGEKYISLEIKFDDDKNSLVVQMNHRERAHQYLVSVFGEEPTTE